VVSAQDDPPHDFGPAPIIVPGQRIGFQSGRHAQPAAEIPEDSGPYGSGEPEDDPDPPVTAHTLPEDAHTPGSLMLDEEPDIEELVAEEELDEPELVEEPEDDLLEPPDDDFGEPPPESPPTFAPPEHGMHAPVRAVRLTAPPVEDFPIEAEDEPPPVVPVVRAPRHQAERPVEIPPAPEESLAAIAEPETRKGKHRRSHSAVSGIVRSSRGRGLRGMRVTVLDEDAMAVATTLTGSGGAFVVDELPPGVYRLTASDEADGDFAASWHDGSTFDNAAAFTVRDRRTRRNTDVTLTSAAAIDVQVRSRRTKIVVTIRVTDRSTGSPAPGFVRLLTKLFDAELPLSKGTVRITLHGGPEFRRTLGKNLQVRYLGSDHTQADWRRVRLR
jgi:hypothetical protein